MYVYVYVYIYIQLYIYMYVCMYTLSLHCSSSFGLTNFVLGIL